jgi:WD40 repeat protein
MLPAVVPEFNPDKLSDKDELQEALKTFVSEMRYRFSPEVSELSEILHVDRTTITTGYEEGRIKKIPIEYVAVVCKLACEKASQANPSKAESYQTEYLKQVNRAIKACYSKAGQLSSWDELCLLAKSYIEKHKKQRESEQSSTTTVVAGSGGKKVSFREDIGRSPDIVAFRGREKDLTALKKRIFDKKNPCQLLLLLGRGGAGKTYLSLKLVQEIKKEFDCYIWRSLEDAREVDYILADWLKILSNFQEAELPHSFEAKVERLLHYLRTQRCLLVLDNVEAIWKSQELVGVYRPGCENYGKLMAALGTSSHQSCVILTSREKPDEIKLAEIDTPRICTWLTNGLELHEARQILEYRNLKGPDEELALLVKSCGGNPRTLQRIFYTIKEYYGSDINQYLVYHLNPDGFLDDREAFEEQFSRLTITEQNILYWLAVEREPVIRQTLMSDLQNPALRYFETALDSLIRRLMIEKFTTSASPEVYYGLQPLDKQYITALLVERTTAEIKEKKFGTLYSVALLKASSAAYILRMQSNLILEPVIDSLLQVAQEETDDLEEAWQQLEERLLYAFRELQTRPKVRQGYTGGNLLNLLGTAHKRQNKPTIIGYDFTNLNLWYAYLAGFDVQETNFSNSDLSGAVFNEVIDEVFCLTYSPNGKYLAAGDVNGIIHLWETPNHKHYARLAGHTKFVRALVFSHDGKFIISCSLDATIRVWKIQTQECVKVSTEHQKQIWTLALSADGKLMVSGSSDGTVKLWDTASWECLRTLMTYPDQRYHGEIRSVAFSCDGKWLALGGANSILEIWDAQHLEKIVSLTVLSSGAINSVNFSSDSQKLAVGSDDRLVKVWGVSDDWPCLLTLEGHTDRPNSVVFSPDNTKLASGARDGTVRIWNADTGECLRQCQGHLDWIHIVIFSPDGETILSCGKDHTIRFWSVATGECIQIIEGYSEIIFTPTFSPDGKLLATGGDDYCIRLWDVYNGGSNFKILRGHKDRVEDLAFSPDGLLLSSGSNDGAVKIWQVATGAMLKDLTFPTRLGPYSVVFSPDGEYLAITGENKQIYLLEVATWQTKYTLQGFLRTLTSLCFSSDNKLLAATCRDGTIRIWNTLALAEGDEPLAVLRGHTRRHIYLTFSTQPTKEGSYILVSGGEDGVINFWVWAADVATFRLLNSWQTLKSIQQLSISPDNKFLAASSHDESVRVWYYRNEGGPLELYWGFQAAERWLGSHISISPDGQLLVTSGYSESKIWNLASKSLHQELRVVKPYHNLNIYNVRGLSSGTVLSLKLLGAISEG